MSNLRLWVAVYFLLQALMGFGWWVSLFVWPESRVQYWPADWPQAGLLVFWLPDIGLFVLGSIASALMVWRQSPGRAAVLWMTFGATAYAALFCVSLAFTTGEAWASAAFMAPASLCTFLAVRAGT